VQRIAVDFCSVFQGQLLFPSIVYNISGTTEPVYGLTASSNGQVFVTRQPKTSNQVSVYDSTTHKLVRKITVVNASGLIQGLVVSSDNNYLYIADGTNVCLFKVNLSSSSTVANWTLANTPRALSVNGLQNILVATASGKIQEYAPNGSLVREVTTSTSTWHAVEMSENLWAVSLFLVNQVRLMASNGTVLYSYGTSGFYPNCLGVDKQGYVFVADFTNNRVVVLNPTLTVVRPLGVTGNATLVMSYPITVYLESSIGYLYVGEYLSPYRVVVLDISHVSTLFNTP
jgi:hypothetical protein